MKTTEGEIYDCLAQIAKMDSIALILSTPVPTPELILEFLRSVISMEKGKSAACDVEPGLRVHVLQAAESLASVQ